MKNVETKEKKEARLQKARDYYANHKDYWKEYASKNRQRITDYSLIYQRRDEAKLAIKIRAATKNFISLKKKNYSEILDCSQDVFKNWIESQFTEEMNWSNYGDVWEYDHKNPLNNFDLLNEFEFKTASFYKNVQPILRNENKSKSNKVNGVSKPKIKTPTSEIIKQIENIKRKREN